MKTWSLAALAALTLGASALTAATAGEWEVKVRAAYLEPADKSDAFSALGIDFAKDAVSVDDKWIPELDIAYALTDNWVIELVLTTPQNHDVTLDGVGGLGDLEHLPPTLSVVYELMPESAFNPYVSAGVNFTWILDEDLSVAGVDLDLDDYSIGLALGAGFQYSIDEKWSIDASVKWIDLESDVSVHGGPKLTVAQLDPFLYSVGASYRF
jgi:outer membrane protein